jgi:hypothetical protein
VSRHSDRLNPILLKEVRQALRGRVFGVLFPTTVLAAVAVAGLEIVERHPDPLRAPEVFLPVYAVLCVAALVLVPFGAFQSMASELDEGTHDLLVLSRLTPARIVCGKLLTSAVEAGLYFSAFLPVLLFAFLLPGVDVRDILFLVGALYLGSVAASTVALALSSLARARFLRVVLLVVLAGVGILGVVGAYAVAHEFVEGGRGIGSGSGADLVLAVLVVVLGAGTVATSIAVSRSAHPEEDRSRPVRVACSLLLVALMAVLTWISSRSGAPWALELYGVLLTLTAVPALFFATESERLPRRAVARAPAHPLAALLVAPFVQGGGRGVVWWLLHAGLLFVWVGALHAAFGGIGPFGRSSRGWTLASVVHALGFTSYFLVYLAGFTLLLARVRERPQGPLIARLTVPAAAVLSVVLPLLAGFALGGAVPEVDELATWPFDLLDVRQPLEAQPAVATAIGALVLALNGPRLVRGVRALVAAGARRRARAPRSAPPSAGAAHAA